MSPAPVLFTSLATGDGSLRGLRHIGRKLRSVGSVPRPIGRELRP